MAIIDMNKLLGCGPTLTVKTKRGQVYFQKADRSSYKPSPNEEFELLNFNISKRQRTIGKKTRTDSLSLEFQVRSRTTGELLTLSEGKLDVFNETFQFNKYYKFINKLLYVSKENSRFAKDEVTKVSDLFEEDLIKFEKDLNQFFTKVS